MVCFGCKQLGHVISKCPSRDVKASRSHLSNVVCYGCKQTGHVISKCPSRDNQDKDKGVVNFVEGVSEPVVCHSREFVDPQHSLKPFQFDGFVSASEGSMDVPVRIMRDTGASHSIIVRDALPTLEDMFTGDNVILQGIGGTVVDPLC